MFQTMKNIYILILIPLSSLLSKQAADYTYKSLVAQGLQIQSYHTKADQSSEIAQTRYQRGLYIMSELSALRAQSQFEQADVSIDAYISKVAGSNLNGVMPWNRKRFKADLMEKAMELRLNLASQEEDIKALLEEIALQLEQADRVSARKTLEKMDELIRALEGKLPNANPAQRMEIKKALELLEGSKNSIIEGIENERDVRDIVESAAEMVDVIIRKNPSMVSAEFSKGPKLPESNDPNFDLRVTPPTKVKGVTKDSEIQKNRAFSLRETQPNAAPAYPNEFGGGLSERFESSTANTKKQGVPPNGIKYIGQSPSGSSMMQLPDGRRIRISRPPQDWPDGRATGHDSIYDDRPGGNLIKEEEIIFERIMGSDGFEITQLEDSKSSRKWNFRIKETGGFDDRYSITNLEGGVAFEIDSWVLRDGSLQVIERLDGNNLHFNPSNLGEGDYSIEVAGITEWNSPFTIVAGVLR